MILTVRSNLILVVFLLLLSSYPTMRKSVFRTPLFPSHDSIRKRLLQSLGLLLPANFQVIVGARRKRRKREKGPFDPALAAALFPISEAAADRLRSRTTKVQKEEEEEEGGGGARCCLEAGA